MAGTGDVKVKGMRAGMSAQMRWRPRSSEDEAGHWKAGGSFLQRVTSARVKRERHRENSEPGIKTLRNEGPGGWKMTAAGGGSEWPGPVTWEILGRKKGFDL